MLEIGLVVRSGREHDDVRRTAVRRRAREQDLSQLVKERRQRVDAQRVKRVRQHARHDGAVLECVADAGRRLRARADDPPFPVGAACEIERHEMQKDAVGGTNTVAGAQETRMPEDEGRRHESFAQQRLRAVDVGRDGVQQPRSLPEAAREPLPLVRLDDQREDVEAPRALPSISGRVDVVGDAVLVDLTCDALLRVGQDIRAQLGRGRELRPWLAQRAVVAAQFVEVPAGHDVAWRTAEAPSLQGSQVQRVGKLQAPFRTAGTNGPRRVGEARESREPPALGLVAVHRKRHRSCVRRDASRDIGSPRSNAPSRCRRCRR